MAELEGAVDTTRDPVRQYALLAEAERLALQYNDVAKALSIISRRAMLFQEDALKMQADMLQGLAGPKPPSDETLLQWMTHTATQAAVAERFEIATDLAKAAVTIAKSIDRSQRVGPRAHSPGELTGPAIIKSAQDVLARIGDRKKAYSAYREAGAVLETQPDDAKANAAVGTYLCLIAGNWRKGLPYLGKGKINQLSPLAMEEDMLLKATPPEPARMFALAEKWWGAGGA